MRAWHARPKERDRTYAASAKRWTSVGKRALKYSLIFSAMAFVASTGLEIYIEYSQRTTSVEGELEDIYASQLPGLVEGLWTYDERLLKALADGIQLSQYVDYVRIYDEASIRIESGGLKGGDAVRTYGLERSYAGVNRRIGWLELGIDSSAIRAEIIHAVARSIFLEAAFLAVVSALFYALFSRMISRRLAAIALFVRMHGAEPEAPPPPIGGARAGDELDLLVDSINAMRERLRHLRAAEKAAVEQLTVGERRYHALIDNAPDAILIYDVTSERFVSCNPRAERIFGRTASDLLSARLDDLLSPDQPNGLTIQDCKDAAKAAAASGETVADRRNILRPDGQIVICEVRYAAMPPAEEAMLRVSYLDITDRVRAEEGVARALAEKEALLREIHHRTKNNMQLIASLLSMRSSESNDGRVRSIVDDMIERIDAMALVHEKLYESRDLSHIDFGEYIEDLLRDIERACLVGRQEIAVSSRTESSIIIPIDTAIPCGLALNELVVNSVRHAFPCGRPGRISVRLIRKGGGILSLIVEDDGEGMPTGFDIHRDGKVGLQTVVGVIESQLRGRVECSTGGAGGPGPGTRWTIDVREDLHGPRV